MDATTTITATPRPTMRRRGRTALALGILSVLHYAIGYALVAWMMPGDPVVIGITTALQYLLPLAGVVAGHLARHREGRTSTSTVALLLSYLCLLAAVVPFLLDLAVFLTAG